MRMDPQQFGFTLRKWRWHHLPPEIAEKLAAQAAPEELVCIKATETRAVYRFENLYIKVCGSFRCKSILFPAAREEYNAYCKLQKNNIPAVKHLGWGRAGHYTALVTQCWEEDATDALRYWFGLAYDIRQSDEFLSGLKDFLNVLVNSKLHHGDFHLGNILYSPSKHAFALVDLHNVYLGRERNLKEKAEMLQILVELRSSIRPQKMLTMFNDIADIPPAMAAEVIRKRLIHDMEHLQRHWQRRMKQFLSGYSKFSSFVPYENKILLVKRDKLRRNIFDPAAARRGEYRTIRLGFSAALEQMLFSFYLSMLQVPHVPVAALAPDGTLYYPRMPESAPLAEDREWINSYNEYLLCMGLNLQEYDQWYRCSSNQLVLGDFSTMLAAMPNRKMFQPPEINPREWKASKF
ncbi:MAG: hypothetical protein IKA65_11385 [Lentisphaeria bacterium]|nr:hypothetical protein [Lentisphaeria bacterium]